VVAAAVVVFIKLIKTNHKLLLVLVAVAVVELVKLVALVELLV
jgi:hypothetical protein